MYILDFIKTFLCSHIQILDMYVELFFSLYRNIIYTYTFHFSPYPLRSFESSLENPTSAPPAVGRDRSISDPRTNSLLLSDSEVSVMTSHQNNSK